MPSFSSMCILFVKEKNASEVLEVIQKQKI